MPLSYIISLSLSGHFSHLTVGIRRITGILLSSHNPHSIVGKIDGSGEKCTGKKRAATSKYYRAHHLDRPISKCIELAANA